LLALPTPRNRWFVNQLKLCDLIAFSEARMLASLSRVPVVAPYAHQAHQRRKPNETQAQLRLLVDAAPHAQFHQRAQPASKRQ